MNIEVIGGIAGFLFIILAADGLGAWLIRSIRPLDFFCLRVGLGLGVISYAVFFLGLAGLLKKDGIFIVSFFMFALLIFLNRDKTSGLLRGFLVSIKGFSRFERAMLGGIAFYLLLIALNCLAPALSRDALGYHLFLPKLWLARGQVFVLPENLYSFFPHLWEMVYVYAMVAGNDITANLLHLFTLGLSLVLLARILRLIAPACPRRWQLLACLVFAATPSVAVTAGWAYIDIAQTFFILLALYLLLRHQATGVRAEFYLSAVCLGFALAIKYFSLVWLVFFLIFAGRHSLRRAAAYGGLAMLFLAPYLLRNYFAAGNPVFPLMYDSWGGKFLDPEKNRLFYLWAAAFNHGTGLKDLLWLPGRLAFDAAFDDWRRFDGVIGAAYLVLAMAAATRWFKTRSFPFHLIYFSAAYLAVWFFTSQQIRFLIPALAIFLAGAVASVSATRGRILTALILVLVFLQLQYPLKLIFRDKPYRFFCGQENRQQYLARNFSGIYPLIETANALGPGTRIMLVLAGQTAYLFDRPVYQEVVFEGYSFVKALGQGRVATLAFLKSCNITHILVDETPLARILDHQNGPQAGLNYLAFRKENLVPLAGKFPRRLYRVVY